MAARRNSGRLKGKTIETPHLPAPIVPDSGEPVDFPDAVAYISSLNNERDGIEWLIKVYKVDASGRGVRAPQLFLFDVDPDDVRNLDSVLAEQYPGGGSFKIVARANGAIVKSAMMDIAPRPGYRPPPPAYLQTVQGPQADNQATDRMEMFFVRMAEIQERSAQQTREMIAALIQQPKAPSITEQLALFTEFQKLVPKGAQENSMDLFQKGMDFASKLFESRGGDGGGSNWLDVVREALHSPVVQNMIAGVAAAAQQGQAAPPAQLGPPAHISPNNPAAVQAIETLIGQASAGVDPKFVASQIGSKVPEEFILELEEQDNVVGYLIRQFPRVAQHRAWFEALVAEMFEDADTPGPSLTPAAANEPKSA